MKRTAPRSVCVVQNAAAEPPGLIADILRAGGWRIRRVRPYRRERVPMRLDGDAGLVILGGPMSVYDAERYPFLDAERRLLEDALARRLPVLGVGLGSQLLAATLGASVVAGDRREMGWHPVRFTRAAANDLLWRGCVADLTAFHWHGDRFDLPKGSTSLAKSDLTECQAFRWGPSAYGFLFHLEVDPSNVARFLRAFQAELLATGQAPTDILDAAPTFHSDLERVGREVLGRWEGLLRSVTE